MINPTFAERFIRRIRTQTDYNINIMNEQGIIIASCNAERIGSFHATAYQMIKNNINLHITEDITIDLPGVSSPGVNFLLKENLIPVGVIGVSGNPDLVLPLAKIIKLSFESLYDYEVSKSLSPTDLSTPINELTNLLFIDRPTNLVRIRSLAKQLNIIENINRYPILIQYEGKDNVKQLIRQFSEEYRSLAGTSHNDLLFRLEGGFILLFKESNNSSVTSYREALHTFINDIEQWFNTYSPGSQIHYYCGTIQCNFQYYAPIYDDMLWLFRYPQKKPSKIYFLADYLTEFMVSNIPTDALTPLFDIYARIIRESYNEAMFIDTVGALIECNMNLNETADFLFFHKNTVASRIKKIRELLGINPLTNTRDAIFITALYKYMV